MKKIIIYFLGMLALIVMGIYIVLPSQITFSKIAIINKNENLVQRFLFKEDNWTKWFPESTDTFHSSRRGSFLFKGNIYQIISTSLYGVNLLIKQKGKSLHTTISILHLNDKKVAIDWESQMERTNNPVKMISNYFYARKLKERMGQITSCLEKFLSVSKNVYGIDIFETKITDTLLVVTKIKTAVCLSTSEIYEKIKMLKNYIETKNAKPTSYPMIHLTKLSDGYETMLGIPVDKEIAESNLYLFKRMVPGKMLVTTINGSQAVVDRAYHELLNYAIDHQRIQIANSFLSLITDRMEVKDSTKWVTKISYPVM
jgi:effector-binding domain-containing protein